MADANPGYSLLHPVYLDVPMMVSFLAHLEGGVSVEEEQTSKQSGARERLLKGRAGLRARFGPIAAAELGAEGTMQRKEEDYLESKTNRHHTAASLFNLLYDYLTDDDQLVNIEESQGLQALRPGQLVELAGEYLGNPLEESLALLAAFLPYIKAQKDAEAEQVRTARTAQRPKRNAARNQPASAQTNPEVAAAAALEAALEEATRQAEAAQEMGIMMMSQIAEDITRVPVHDVLVRTAGGVNAVLTVNSDFYSPTTHEYLRAGEFRVIGKITRVLAGDKVINLTRRTVMGAMPSNTAQETLSGLSNSEGLSLDLADPIITAPGIQILPMAIFL